VIFPGKWDPVSIPFHPGGMGGTGVDILRKVLHMRIDRKKNGTGNVGTPLVPMLDCLDNTHSSVGAVKGCNTRHDGNGTVDYRVFGGKVWFIEVVSVTDVVSMDR
jgi:hypothetical protein